MGWAVNAKIVPGNFDTAALQGGGKLAFTGEGIARQSAVLSGGHIHHFARPIVGDNYGVDVNVRALLTDKLTCDDITTRRVWLSSGHRLP